jgi:phosphoribosylanthranilate isomerase
MSVAVKICGVNSRLAAEAAVAGGAAFVGFVFYPPSPRHVAPAEAGQLALAVPPGIKRVGLFVDADDGTIAGAVAAAGLDVLQLHGAETPERVAALKARFALAAMKAIRIAGAEDVGEAERYLDVADWLLFDAKPPVGMAGALPGGNALSFDWRLIAGRRWPKPWMLSGGLNAENLAEAVGTSGARVVDVSSGVEDRPGHKDARRIAAFLKTARRL